MIKGLFTGRVTVGDVWVGSLLSIGLIFWLMFLTSFFEPLIRDFSIISLIVFFVFWASILIRRLHDLNRPGWWALGIFIPGLNLVLSVYVSWWSGTKGENKYGPIPEKIQPNRIKRILGLR